MRSRPNPRTPIILSGIADSRHTEVLVVGDGVMIVVGVVNVSSSVVVLGVGEEDASDTDVAFRT